MILRTKRLTGTIKVKDVELDIQQLTPSDLKAIKKKNTKWVGRPGNMRNELDEAQYAFDMFDKQVIGWRNMTDDKGKEVECNTQNKSFVYEYDQAFVAEALNKAGDYLEEQREAIEKN